MKTLALLALALSSVTGCLPGGSCGGFDGGSDRVLSRGNDAITLCENGGYYASINGAVLEGKQQAQIDSSVAGTDGPTQTTSFILMFSTDNATATAPDLGDGEWTVESLNPTELDHADIQCQDLVSRSWW